MNIENLNKLRNWLLAGAPHAVLEMNVGVGTWQSVFHHENHDIGNTKKEQTQLREKILVNQPGKGDCGTVCCIAGAAQLMSKTKNGDFPNVTMQREVREITTWDLTAHQALEWLGLPNMGVQNFYHDLFDMRLAPEFCTPQQAAQAVQNVMDGKEPWDGIEG